MMETLLFEDKRNHRIFAITLFDCFDKEEKLLSQLEERAAISKFHQSYSVIIL